MSHENVDLAVQYFTEFPKWEAWRKIGVGSWVRFYAPNFSPVFEWQLRPANRTVTLPERTVPQWETEAPPVGATYFIPSPADERWYVVCRWYGHEHDHRNLARNLVHLKADDAIARAKSDAGVNGE